MAQQRHPGGMTQPAASQEAPGPIASGSLASPVGDLYVACSPDGVVQVSFGLPGRGPAAGGAARGDPPGRARELLADAIRQLTGYFAGRRRAFDLPVDWSGTTGTQQQVLTALLAGARFGETITYGELARLAGLPDDGDAGPPGRHFPPARVVGQVMGSNPCPVIVPCHRVVAGDGLGGYSGGAGTEIKRWLLIFEGALPPTLDWDPAGAGLPVTP